MNVPAISTAVAGLGPAGNGVNGLLVLAVAVAVMYFTLTRAGQHAQSTHESRLQEIRDAKAALRDEVFENPYAEPDPAPEPARPVLRLIEGEGLGYEPGPVRRAQ